jgi:superfamily II DNA/RNA helicase
LILSCFLVNKSANFTYLAKKTILTFDDFYFDYGLMDALDAMGFNKPTPIQEKAIPVILEHKDLIACAQTGTGKTAAYVLPILNKIAESDHSHLNTLILAPTRELAMQIDQQVQGFSYYIQVSSIPIYGGGDGATWEQQKKALKHGADIIIATPGRLISQLASGDINFTKLEHLVLDEADRMLDMGFYDDIVKIISYLPKDRQTLLFSATMPPKIRTLAAKILYKPEEISISISKPAAGIDQQAYMTYDAQKIPLLGEIFKGTSYQSVIIFAGTKEKVKSLQFELKKIGLKAKSFHSDLEQKEREELMNDFRSRKVQVLIGTDILSRGIDVDGIDLVVNFDVPPDPEDYVHRIGRTARAESKGTAITFINEKDQRRFHAIEGLIEREIPKTPLPAGLGAAPIYSPRTSRPEPNRRFNKPKRK